MEDVETLAEAALSEPAVEDAALEFANASLWFLHAHRDIVEALGSKEAEAVLHLENVLYDTLETTREWRALQAQTV